MGSMFASSQVTSLDLSSFDMSNVWICSGIIFSILKFSPSNAPIITYVPASILSGIETILALKNAS